MKAELFCQEGTSDKVYNVAVVSVGGDQYSVNFTYGKRGSALKEGTKTIIPVTLSQAMKIFDALVAEKTKKGYKPVTGAIAEPVRWFRVLTKEECEKMLGYDEPEDMKEQGCTPIETTVQQLADNKAGTCCGTVGNHCFVNIAAAGFGNRCVRGWFDFKENCLVGMPLIESTEAEADKIENAASEGQGSLRPDGESEECAGMHVFEIE